MNHNDAQSFYFSQKNVKQASVFHGVRTRCPKHNTQDTPQGSQSQQTDGAAPRIIDYGGTKNVNIVGSHQRSTRSNALTVGEKAYQRVCNRAKGHQHRSLKIGHRTRSLSNIQCSDQTTGHSAADSHTERPPRNFSSLYQAEKPQNCRPTESESFRGPQKPQRLSNNTSKKEKLCISK